MQRTHALVGIVVRGSRWGLPWIGTLVISTSLAYTLNTAVSGGPAAREPDMSTPAALTSADPDSSLAPERCEASVGGPIYVGLDSWIVAESRRVGCEQAAPIMVDGSDSSESCDISGRRLLYVGLNTWIPAEPKLAPCPESVP
jgi:hypothetical protein